MSTCEQSYATGDNGTRRCRRPGHPDAETGRCVFHLSRAERQAAGVTRTALREAFAADAVADDDTRREYVDIDLATLDLSSLVVDGPTTDTIVFRDVTVEGTLNLSESVFEHPIAFEHCRLGRLDATRATFGGEVTLTDSTIGDKTGTATPFTARHGSFERSLRLHNVRVDGAVECAACQVVDWLMFDEVAVTGTVHLPGASLRMVQFLAVDFAAGAEFGGTTAEHLTVDGGRIDGLLDFSACTIETLRVRPADDILVRLDDATVEAGRLDQPTDGVGLYDLTDATVGAVTLECTETTVDRYRFYRTSFDRFPFDAYRHEFRDQGWRLHEFAGEPVEPADRRGLERTYLQAKLGATQVGDNESASAFFLREVRYRRQEYAAHVRARHHSLTHRLYAALRWVMGVGFDLVAGYGERPQRVLAVSLALILAAAVSYPATGGLDTGGGVVSYATDGPAAVVDGLYFSAVTFATLGLGDVYPVDDLGRSIAAIEGLAGALLTALFIFSLGRRVAR